MIRVSMRVWILGLISLVLVVGILVPGIGRSVLAATGQRPAAATVNVSIENFAFSPATVNVAVGSTVVWTQKDSVAHTVTSDNNAWPDSGPLNQGATFSHTFTKPGTYTYHCAIHPNMTGTIVVGAAASATTSTPKTGSTSGGMSAMGPMSITRLTGWTGYYDGAKVTYITTDTSSKTEAARDHINYAPILAKSLSNASQIYLITNGSFAARGPVFGSVPGASDYTPLWQEVLVTWKNPSTAVALGQDDQIKALAKQGKLTMTMTGTVINCPIITKMMMPAGAM